MRTDLQNIQLGMHKLGYDFAQYTRLVFRKYLDKDPNIFDLYKLCLKDILNWQHIQVYILVDYPYNLASKSKRLDH